MTHQVEVPHYAKNTITKKDLKIELAPIKSELTLVKWMLGIIVAGVTALVLKSFF